MGISLISNPPYNLRWTVPDLAGFLPQYAGYEIPPASNANMAFILSALNWIEDRAVLLLPNGVLSSSQKQEQVIRRQLIRENLLLAVITLPPDMFESTNIPTCLLVFDNQVVRGSSSRCFTKQAEIHNFGVFPFFLILKRMSQQAIRK